MTTVDTNEGPIERKVQLTGGSTYTVSLPKEWAATQGIDVGSTMQLYSRRDRLVLTHDDPDADPRRVVIDARECGSADLGPTLAAAYVVGCEEIRIEGLSET